MSFYDGGERSLLAVSWLEILDDYSPSRGFLNSDEFKKYQRKIERLILKYDDPRGMTTRAIHEALGWQARYEWTQDALDGLKTITAHGVVLTRYRRAGKVRRLPKQRFDEAFAPAAMMRRQFR